LQRLWRCTGGTRAGAGSCCVEQSARLFVVATSPSHRTSWHTRASTRTIVGMSTERWCPLNMVWLNRRSAASSATAASSQLSPEQSASSPRSTTGPPRHAPRWRFRGRSTADRRSSALLEPAATAGAGRPGAPHLQREWSASRVVWSLQPAGPPSRGHAERYAERPDAEEVHPEDGQKKAGSWWGRGYTCEVVGRHHGDVSGVPGAARSGAAAERPEPPVAHRLANHQGFPNRAVYCKRPARVDSFRHAVFAARRPAPPPTRRRSVPAAHAEQARGV
jgi:hypothetical protein